MPQFISTPYSKQTSDCFTALFGRHDIDTWETNLFRTVDVTVSILCWSYNKRYLKNAALLLYLGMTHPTLTTAPW